MSVPMNGVEYCRHVTGRPQSGTNLPHRMNAITMDARFTTRPGELRCRMKSSLVNSHLIGGRSIKNIMAVRTKLRIPPTTCQYSRCSAPCPSVSRKGTYF